MRNTSYLGPSPFPWLCSHSLGDGELNAWLHANRGGGGGCFALSDHPELSELGVIVGIGYLDPANSHGHSFIRLPTGCFWTYAMGIDLPGYKPSGHNPMLLAASAGFGGSLVPMNGAGWCVTLIFPPGSIIPAEGLTPNDVRGQRLNLLDHWAEDGKDALAALRSCTRPEELWHGIQAIIADIISNQNLKSESLRAAELVRSGYRLIRDSFGRIEAKDIAQELRVSDSRLRRVFREHSLYSPKELCHIHRFWDAMNTYILDTEQAWSTVAEDCGFSDGSHLNRIIKKITGVRPQRLQELFRAGCFMNTGLLILPHSAQQYPAPLLGDSVEQAQALLNDYGVSISSPT